MSKASHIGFAVPCAAMAIALLGGVAQAQSSPPPSLPDWEDEHLVHDNIDETVEVDVGGGETFDADGSDWSSSDIFQDQPPAGQPPSSNGPVDIGRDHDEREDRRTGNKLARAFALSYATPSRALALGEWAYSVPNDTATQAGTGQGPNGAVGAAAWMQRLYERDPALEGGWAGRGAVALLHGRGEAFGLGEYDVSAYATSELEMMGASVSVTGEVSVRRSNGGLGPDVFEVSDDSVFGVLGQATDIYDLAKANPWQQALALAEFFWTMVADAYAPLAGGAIDEEHEPVSSNVQNHGPEHVVRVNFGCAAGSRASGSYAPPPGANGSVTATGAARAAIVAANAHTVLLASWAYPDRPDDPPGLRQKMLESIEDHEDLLEGSDVVNEFSGVVEPDGTSRETLFFLHLLDSLLDPVLTPIWHILNGHDDDDDDDAEDE